MIAESRRVKLLEVIRQRSFASLPDLAEVMAVSESTIRRDLEQLEASGVAKRTHGGVFYIGPRPHLQHFDDRQTSGWGRKRAISRVAADLIEDGDTVLLDGGSTTYELAQLLVGRPLQIVTNSLPVATLFTSSMETDLVMIGGYIHSRTGVSLGPYALGMLEELNARRAILSVAGVNERGYFNSNLLLVETEKAMMRAVDEVIIVADSTKFGHQSLALLCELGEIHRLVVDDAIDKPWLNKLAAAGVDVRLASVEDADEHQDDEYQDDEERERGK
ncbi:MAG: DeoR/GlpR family DNA-binding transcription regulator [Pirellulaceae bacterium]|nr:DeoR/GlpR family DNA-binding transcription regulator [Pirellulaceae bacterium]